nr:phospholipase-like protein [Tanacetum cinerariifolium]
MSDEDDVRIASELVFMGKEKRNFLTKYIIWLVDDFDAWNALPWDEYMWEKFYNRIVNVVSIHTEHHLAQLKKNPNFNATYNLYGFAWAFKIWILESYPKSKKWSSKKANVIPRGLAWSKVTAFEKSIYEELFRPMSNPNVALISSPEEMCQAWFKASADFIKGLDNQDVDNGDGVLDSQSDDEDGVFDSQTKDVIEEAEVLLIKRRKDDEFDELTKIFSKFKNSKTFVKFKKLLTNDLCTKNISSDCNPKKSDGGVSIEEKLKFSSHHNDSLNHIGNVSSEAKASSSSTHPGNDEDVSHLDDNMEIDGQNAKDGYSKSQHHFHLIIKALGTKIENPSIDLVVVVSPKVDYPMLRTIKPKDDFDKADVDSYDDDYMSLLNDKEQPAKLSLNDLELQQEPDIADVKDGILEKQANADKRKTTVIQETVGYQNMKRNTAEHNAQ